MGVTKELKPYRDRIQHSVMAMVLNKMLNVSRDDAEAVDVSSDVSNRHAPHSSSLTKLVRGLANRFAGQRDLRAVLTGATQVMAIRMVGAALTYISTIFMARWLGGMGIRLLGLGVVLIFSRTLPALLSYVAVLLPLLFLETRFLR